MLSLLLAHFNAHAICIWEKSFLTTKLDYSNVENAIKFKSTMNFSREISLGNNFRFFPGKCGKFPTHNSSHNLSISTRLFCIKFYQFLVVLILKIFTRYVFKPTHMQYNMKKYCYGHDIPSPNMYFFHYHTYFSCAHEMKINGITRT